MTKIPMTADPAVVRQLVFKRLRAESDPNRGWRELERDIRRGFEPYVDSRLEYQRRRVRELPWFAYGRSEGRQMSADKKVQVGGSLVPSGTFSADVRSSLTPYFLMAAASQANGAASIESKPPGEVTEDEQDTHRGLVMGAIMQGTAALECEIWEVMIYGPGHHLGSNGIDLEAQAFLAPAAETIDGKRVLERYRLVLHLLKKKPLDRSRQPWQDTELVVRLRNELVHYKSRWGKELASFSWLTALEDKRHPRPPFIQGNANFFPLGCLSACCASWAVRSCVGFMDAFYENLGFPDRLEPFRRRLQVGNVAKHG